MRRIDYMKEQIETHQQSLLILFFMFGMGAVALHTLAPRLLPPPRTVIVRRKKIRERIEPISLPRIPTPTVPRIQIPRIPTPTIPRSMPVPQLTQLQQKLEEVRRAAAARIPGRFASRARRLPTTIRRVAAAQIGAGAPQVLCGNFKPSAVRREGLRYRFYYRCWQNYCPFCKRRGWLVMHWCNRPPCVNICPPGRGRGNTADRRGFWPEGHIFCCWCDADFCGATGWDHMNPPRARLRPA